MKELTKKEMQNTGGGLVGAWIIGMCAGMLVEYIYDKDQAFADFERGYNSTNF